MKYYTDDTQTVYAYDDDTPNVFIGNKTPISEQEAMQMIAEQQQADFDALPWFEKRQISYPPICDYMCGIIDDSQTEINAYIDACKAINAKYPPT